jgi:Tripartite tricarboxylate transporter TctB family
MAIKSHKDFVSGLMFTAVGAAFAMGARDYTVGTAARMGPGYFPLLLGIILAVLGLLVTLKSFGGQLREGEEIGKIAWRPLGFIIGSNLLFGVLLGGLPSIGLPSFGLLPAIVALVVVAALAGNEFKLKEVLVLSAILAVGSWLTFVKLLNLPFQLWPAFITG